jgi:hypothetical protein
MLDDLQHAQASVDWAKSQLPPFRKRLSTWLNDNIHMVIREQPPDVPNNVLVALEKEPLPLSFQVEAGAYLNTIRSSLDILAVTLANRHCQSLADEAYFPIVQDAAAFARAIVTGKGFKWAKFVKALPAKERSIIESLKPYQGGNGLLWPLHQLDIVRKHSRLLAVEIQPQTLKVSGWGNATKAFIPTAAWVRTGDDETVLGLIAKSAEKHPKIELTPQVSLSEAAYLPHGEVITALYEFANLATAIINDFRLV